ncbi:DUF1315 family protein [Rheinheimera sp.]|uniref:YeaC family protein n=1 Tax=Rheinheimera sp. TaxID=1869214 RepID=UPI00307D8E8B
MDFRALVSSLSPDAYQSLLDAIATGRWADGVALSDAQKDQTHQLVMAYQAYVLKSDEPYTIGPDGQMVVKSKAQMKKELSPDSIARFNHDDL